MKLSILMTVLVAAGLTTAPISIQAQDDYRSAPLDVRQHGYQHGYRDGFDYGRDVRVRNVALDYRTDAYRDAEHGYQPYLGSGDGYRDGYRQGYSDGAQDGYNGVTSRLEQTFSWRDRNFDPDVARENGRAAVSYDPRWDYRDVAEDVGYRDGVNAGLNDFREHHSYRPEWHGAYKDADHGYVSSFGPKDEYKRAYRTAYENGYRAGFGLLL